MKFIQFVLVSTSIRALAPNELMLCCLTSNYDDVALLLYTLCQTFSDINRPVNI